jgi:hypothetical protein
MAEQSKLPALEEVYDSLKTDAESLLRELLLGISMWGVTSLMAFLLCAASLILAVVVTLFGRPYGNPPSGVSSETVLAALYTSLALAATSAVVGSLLLQKYLTLKKKYSRLFQIARELR